MSIFDKYAKKINAEELAASQKEITENASGGDYKEVPLGKYEVKIEKMEAKLTKESKRPMVSIWFKILKGDYKDSMIFYNGVFHEDWMRHRVVEFLSAILDDDTHKAEINLILKDSNINEINDFVMDIHEQVDGNLEYLLDYSMNKGFNTYKIEEVFDAE
jgi:hypothetical protein